MGLILPGGPIGGEIENRWMPFRQSVFENQSGDIQRVSELGKIVELHFRLAVCLVRSTIAYARMTLGARLKKLGDRASQAINGSSDMPPALHRAVLGDDPIG